MKDFLRNLVSLNVNREVLYGFTAFLFGRKCRLKIVIVVVARVYSDLTFGWDLVGFRSLLALMAPAI